MIESQDALQEVLAPLSQARWLSLDTEFIRTSTYYAKLALLQIFDGNRCYLIDPLSVTDLTELWHTIAEKEWVLHSFGEDIELLNLHAPRLSSSIFDSQIACAFLGEGLSMGYAAALEKYLGVTISKSQSRTDWLQRPLSKAQLSYAREDVVHLYELYPLLSEAVEQKGLTSFFQQECAFQVAQRLCVTEPDLAYRQIKNGWQLTAQQLCVLRELARWRLNEARRRDMALNRVVKEENLLLLAKVQPDSEGQLRSLLLPQEFRHHGRTLLNLIQVARAASPDEWPALLIRPIDIPKYKQRFKAAQEGINQIAEQYQLPAELLASKKSINQFLLWQHGGEDGQRLPALLQGWRGELLKTRLMK